MTLTGPQRDAISRYIAGGYVRINGDCRGDSDGDPKIWREIYLLDEALAEAFLQEDQIVYRGVDKAYAAELERRLASAGDSLIDKAFLSTSRSKVVARGFIGYEEGGLLMKIRVPQGRRALYLAPYSSEPDEQEYLLPRDTVLKLIGYDEDEDVLELEVA
jgi:hypothetical protein